MFLNHKDMFLVFVKIFFMAFVLRCYHVVNRAVTVSDLSTFYAPQGCIYLFINTVKTVILRNIIAIKNKYFLFEL